jgi:tetratricopeptide (TPR) repeat protein
MDSKRNNTLESIPTPRHHIWLVSIGLTVATLAIYAQVLQFPFVSWDDPGYIYENSHISDGLTMESVKWALTSGYAANWHPVTWISHILDIELFGLERGPGESFLQGPGGHHLVSLLLHTANSLLLLLLLYRMTGVFWPSALTAALFAFHPLRVESVAWASERKDVLSGLFFMLTLLAYHGYTQRPSFRRYILVFIALALGLMSKPMLVTVPFLLLLLDLWPLRRWELPHWPPRRILLEKLPLLALVFASCLVTLLAQKAGGAVSSLDRLSWAWRLINTPVAYAMYFLKSLWPRHLAYSYPHPGSLPMEQLGDWVVMAVGATLCLGLLSVIAFNVARRWPYLLVGWLWFLGMLLPVIGLMQVGQQAWADRYAYLPLVGVYVMISWSLIQLIHQRPALRRAVIVVVVGLLLVLLPCTWRQVAVWRDGQSLYTHALAVTRNNYMAHYNLANDLQGEGRIEEAVMHQQQALSINWNLANAHNNLGNLFARSGRPQEALAHYEEALRCKPDYFEAHGNWGNALQMTGRHEEALEHYREALQLHPNYVEAHYNWGKALHTLGKSDEAILHYEQALQINPKLAEAHNALGRIHEEQGRHAEAIRHFEKALQLTPDYAAARDSLRELRAELDE